MHCHRNYEREVGTVRAKTFRYRSTPKAMREHFMPPLVINLLLLVSYIAFGWSWLTTPNPAPSDIVSIRNMTIFASLFFIVMMILKRRKNGKGSILRYRGLYVPFYIPYADE